VRHGVDRVCKLAVGAEVPPGTSGEAKIGRGLTICTVNWKRRPRDEIFEPLKRHRIARCCRRRREMGVAYRRRYIRRTSHGNLPHANDPKSSVVDKYHRADDVQTCSLWMAAASTSGRNQPTCTIQALAYRAADNILARQRVEVLRHQFEVIVRRQKCIGRDCRAGCLDSGCMGGNTEVGRKKRSEFTTRRDPSPPTLQVARNVAS